MHRIILKSRETNEKHIKKHVRYDFACSLASRELSAFWHSIILQLHIHIPMHSCELPTNPWQRQVLNHLFGYVLWIMEDLRRVSINECGALEPSWNVFNCICSTIPTMSSLLSVIKLYPRISHCCMDRIANAFVRAQHSWIANAILLHQLAIMTKPAGRTCVYRI